jgi:predicted amidohydrolase
MDGSDRRIITIRNEILMKIALCQINPTVGALDDNKALILSKYKEAVENGADLVVFPEMVITGYPIADLLYEDGFVDENMKVLCEIADKSTVPLILGYINKDKEHLFNSAAVCVNGKQVYRYDKILLPTTMSLMKIVISLPGKTSVCAKLKLAAKRSIWVLRFVKTFGMMNTSVKFHQN